MDKLLFLVLNMNDMAVFWVPQD